MSRDGTGQRWMKLLGHERATFAMRYLFSLILIGLGGCALYIAFTSS